MINLLSTRHRQAPDNKQTIIIQPMHGLNYTSAYSHCLEKLAVSVERIRAVKPRYIFIRFL